MDKAGRRLPAALEDRGITLADLGHLRLGDGPIVERRAPVRAPLEDGQVARRLRDLGDGLHAGGTRADDGHALAHEGHGLLGPEPRVIGLALEVLDARDSRQRGGGERADCGDEIARAVEGAVFQRDVPRLAVFVPGRGLHPASELDVAAQVELVGDVVQVTLGLRLGSEVLGPDPLVEQLLAERVAVGVALGVEAAAGVAIPVPGAPDAGAGFEDADLLPHLAQAMELVEAGDPGADEDGVEVRHRRHRTLR